MKIKGFAECLGQIACVAVRNGVQRITVYHNHRRIHAALVGITHFRTHQTCARRLLTLDCALQDTRDFRRRHLNHCRVVGSLNAFKQTVNTAFFQCRNKVELSKIKEIQFAVDIAFHLLATLFADAVPFIDRHHQGTACFQSETCNRRILIGDILLRIQYQDSNVCRLNRLHGFDNGELFHYLIHFAATAHACGIDDGKRFTVAFKIDMDTVTRRACHIEGNHAFFTEDGVYQGRFTDIWTADYSKNRMFRFFLFLFRLREGFQNIFNQIIHAIAVRT